MGRRTKARECALQMLYQWELTGEPMDARGRGLLAGAHRHATRRRPWPSGWPSAPQARAGSSTRPITGGRAQLAVRPHRAGRPNDPAPRGLRARCERETPAAVVIDEAVELAKRFGEADTPAFVNGVLDAIAQARPRRAGGRPRWRATKTSSVPVPGGPRSRPSGSRRRARCAALGRRSLPDAVRAHATPGRDRRRARRADARGARGARRGGARRRARAHEARPRQGLLRHARRRRGPAADLRAPGRGGRGGLPRLRPRRPRRLRGRRGHGHAHAQGRADRRRRASSRSCRRRSCRRPRSGTASPTSRRATASATST